MLVSQQVYSGVKRHSSWAAQLPLLARREGVQQQGSQSTNRTLPVIKQLRGRFGNLGHKKNLFGRFLKAV